MVNKAFPWSPSRLSAYLSCPHAYFLSYLQHEEPTINPAIALGSAFHAIVKQNSKAPKDGSRPTFFKSEESFARAWWAQQYWGKHKGDFEEKIFYYYGWIGGKALLEYWKRNLSQPTYSEFPFKQENIVYRGYRLTGVMDQVIISSKREITIIDLKLSQGNPTSGSWQKWLNRGIQLTIYWYAAQILWRGFPINLLVDHYWIHEDPETPKDEKTHRGNMIVTRGFYPTTRDETDLIDLFEILEFVASGVQTEQFPHTENSIACRYCLYAHACEKGVDENRRAMGMSPLEIVSWEGIVPAKLPPREPPAKQLRFRWN